jgi:hypothetical protein
MSSSRFPSSPMGTSGSTKPAGTAGSTFRPYNFTDAVCRMSAEDAPIITFHSPDGTT